MIDVIIPTYKPGAELISLIEGLKSQSLRPDHIILMNTEEAYFANILKEKPDLLGDEILQIYHIRKSDFDHGRTRNEGIKHSKADICVLMTQDALPADEYFIANLVAPLADESIAASYARQLAGEGSSIIEQVTREFNYPDQSLIKGREDTDRLGIKTYFCSNVSCAYKRAIYDKLGGFIDHTIFNEDMIYAAKAIKNDYKIAYAADAKVYHSHNYTVPQQFHRNVDIGISQAEHPEVFEGISSESEGKRLVKTTISRLIEAKEKRKILPYIYMTGCKYIGYKIGKNYRKLPMGFIKKVSMNPEYFN